MSLTRRLPSVATLALFALAAVPVVALAEAWEREFATGMESQDTNVQYFAVTKLDPANPKGRDFLYNVAATGSWHLRAGAIETLAKSVGDAVDDMRKQMKSHKSALTREAIVYAFTAMKSPDRVPDLIEALKDKAPEVRRAATLGIVALPTKDGVAAIVDAWKKEKEWTVKVYYKDALEKLTKNYFGWQIQDWENWWLAKGDKWRPPKPKKEKKPGEEGKKDDEGSKDDEKKDGDKGNGEKKDGEKGGDASDDQGGGEGKEKPAEETTTLRDVELTVKESGKGGPLFVLPALYRNKLYLEMHLKALEDAARLYYIDLPPMSKFRGLKNLGKSGMAYYPVDAVCDAFDELRKERKQEKIAILAHEMAGWVAMRYAAKYPNNVSHLILISTWPSSDRQREAWRRVEADGRAKKNIELEHASKNHFQDPNTNKTGYDPKDPQEAEAMHRAIWTTWFGDPKSIFAEQWYKDSHVDMGGMWTPDDFNVAKDKSNAVPTLIVYGAKSLWCNDGDVQTLSKCYPGATSLQCPNSSELPFVDDHALFTKQVHEFFAKHPFPKKSGKS